MVAKSGSRHQKCDDMNGYRRHAEKDGDFYKNDKGDLVQIADGYTR